MCDVYSPEGSVCDVYSQEGSVCGWVGRTQGTCSSIHKTHTCSSIHKTYVATIIIINYSHVASVWLDDQYARCSVAAV